ncbi:MAG: Na/Pi symporter [Porticoccaceae bacterium]
MGILTFIGGVGLFLLGMRLMTDGLKVAAGDSLRDVLSAATRSRARGLVSGVLITAIVQSSAAVILATIGFVNAGLLSLVQSVGIILGANLGTTLTSWIVAILGFNIDIKAMALPAVGLGMGLWVIFGNRRQGALGQALVGFGIFFLGIDVLKDSFSGIDEAIALEDWMGQGTLGTLLFVLIGIVLTVLMQSSSAALAVTLTAAAGGLIPLGAAAGMVIGANVGTTSTAILGALGATAPARRAASAHVVFNVITAIAAIILLPLMLWTVKGAANLLGFGGQTAVMLAIFHTMTKVLGIVITWPFMDAMVAFLERRFRSTEEEEGRPHHLDSNVLAAPALAVDALLLELNRMAAISRRIAQAAVSAEESNPARLEGGLRSVEHLNLAVSEFVSKVADQAGESRVNSLLPDTLRVSHYLLESASNALEMARLAPQGELLDPSLAETRNRVWHDAAQALSLSELEAEDWRVEKLRAAREHFEQSYQAMKAELLRAGTTGVLRPRQMATLLEHLSALHRMVDQAVKGALYLVHVTAQHHGEKDGSGIGLAEGGT